MLVSGLLQRPYVYNAIVFSIGVFWVFLNLGAFPWMVDKTHFFFCVFLPLQELEVV